MAFVKAAAVADVAPGVGKPVEVAGRRLALFLTEGQYYAIDATCPHRGAPLDEGECIGSEVICPWHDARFDLKTGAHLCPPARNGVRSYPVRVNGNDIEVDVG